MQAARGGIRNDVQEKIGVGNADMEFQTCQKLQVAWVSLE